MMEMLRTEDLGFSYGEDRFALKDVSISVQENEFISIVGRNGSGKSTLVKLLSGIHINPSGKVIFKGEDIKNYDRKALSRNLCYLSQTGVVFTDRISVKDFLLLGRYSYKNFSDFRYNDDDETVVNESLLTAGIADFKDRDVSELSGGERQKVLITLALVQLNITEDLKGKLLIIDEPLTYLDVNYQHEIFSILHKLNTERNLTILVVMHDLTLALKYTHKTLLMDKGRLIFSGKTREVINEENLREYFLINSTIINSNNELLINYLPKL